METITCCPGVVAMERYDRFAYVRWQPASAWFSSSYRLDDWKGHVHLVAKASLLPSIRESLYLRLPEDVIPPDRRLDLAMVRGTSLVTISDELRTVLLEKGVRVWTVGYTRHSSLFRLLAVGGGEPLLWIQQDLREFFGMYSGIELMPVLPGPPPGRPPAVPWYGWDSDSDRLDRILRSASGGVLDEPSILLAEMLGRERVGNLHAPEAERRADGDLQQMIATDPQAAEEGCYADLQWTSWRRWNGDEDAASTPALARTVAALASADGPPGIEVAGVGAFLREALPPMQLVVTPPRVRAGLPAISGDLGPAPTQEWLLCVGATHRYTCYPAPGA